MSQEVVIRSPIRKDAPKIIGADLSDHGILFDKKIDFPGECESQTLFRVGPFNNDPELIKEDLASSE